LTTPLNGCVCGTCWEGILPVDRHVLEDGSALAALISLGAYQGPLRDIIHALKYQGRRSIAPKLALAMGTAARDLLSSTDGVVPVPLHWRREYARGFNQAREIAMHLGPPMLDVLRRWRPTRPQIELSKEQRLENVMGVFALKRRSWRKPPTVRGMTLAVIDDVSTTGATLLACAEVLKRAGAARVYGLTAARKI
jgi:ComF family protein